MASTVAQMVAEAEAFNEYQPGGTTLARHLQFEQGGKP